MRWLERPPKVLCAASVLWFLVSVAVFSDAGVPFPAWLALSGGSVGLAACCILRLTTTYIQDRRYQRAHIRRDIRWWTAIFAIVIGGFVLAGTMPLLSVRVYLSAESLLDSGPVLSTMPQESLYRDGKWIGLFHVTEFSHFGSELRFITNECGLVDTCGIVFSPEGPP
jgi:hypothetical protein